jgi:serine/threonine protein kinase
MVGDPPTRATPFYGGRKPTCPYSFMIWKGRRQSSRDRGTADLLACAAALPLEPGIIIGGTYRVEQQLGRGAMGEVWAGVRMVDGAPVALKVLQTGAAERQEVVARFRREAQVLGRVRSDFIARVIDFQSDPTHGLLLVMELIAGESLLAILNRERRIKLDSALSVGLDIARGLKDLHAARIVHRDLKPGNVVLKPIGDGRFRAVLIDFGISRIISNPEEQGEEVTSITRAGTVLGTLEYIAPEQIFGSHEVTGSADLYALGAIIYRCVAGQHAFVANADAALLVLKMTGEAPALPIEGEDVLGPRARTLVANLLEKDPDRRYQAAEHVIAELEAILSLVYDEGEFPTGIRAAPVQVVELDVDPDPSVTDVELNPAVGEDDDETASQIAVEWDPEEQQPEALSASDMQPEEGTSEEEIQTIFRPPQPLQHIPQPAVMVQPHVLQAAPMQPQGPARVPVSGQMPFTPPGVMPNIQAVPGQPLYGYGTPGKPRSQKEVQTIPSRGMQLQGLPPPPPMKQSAIETVHISAYRNQQRSPWVMLIVAIVAAAIAGAIVTWLVLPRLLQVPPQ